MNFKPFKGYHTMITSKKKYTSAELDELLLRTDLNLTDVIPDDCDEKLSIYSYTSKLAFLKNVNSNLTCLLRILRSELKVVYLKFLKNKLAYGLSRVGNYGWVTNSNIFYDYDFFTDQDPIPLLKQDLELLSASFPFLEFNITLFDRSCKEDDAVPLLSLKLTVNDSKGSDKDLKKFKKDSKGVISGSSNPSRVRQTRKSVVQLHGRERVRHSLTISEYKCLYEKNYIPCAIEEEQLLRFSKIVSGVIEETLLILSKYDVYQEFEDIIKKLWNKPLEELTQEEIEYFERVVVPNCGFFRVATIRGNSLE